MIDDNRIDTTDGDAVNVVGAIVATVSYNTIGDAAPDYVVAGDGVHVESSGQTPGLQLPHARITEREFVLRPLADIRPDLVLPRQTEPVGALLLQFTGAGAVVRIAAEW